MKYPPQLPNKKHCLGPNKLKHTQVQPIFYFPCMETLNSLTSNITPPHTPYISLRNNSHSEECNSTRIMVEHCYKRCGKKLHTKPCLRGPGAGINQMVPMMRPSMRSAKFTVSNSNRNNRFFITIIIIKNMKQTHYFFEYLCRRIGA